MKIALLTGSISDGCATYRMLPWRKLGHEATWYEFKSGFYLTHAILENDLIIISRPYTVHHHAILVLAKELGKKIIIDWDDDMTCVEPCNPNYEAFLNCQPHIEACAKLADAITVSTSFLKLKATSWGGKRIFVIKNAIDDSYKNLTKHTKRSKTVAWRGSKTHVEDMQAGRKQFTSLAKTHQLVFFGSKPDWKIEHQLVPEMDYINYMSALNRLAPEFMYVPLVDCDFNRAKSDIAAQECYAVGAKLIHNGVGEYNGLLETQEPRWLSEVNSQREVCLGEVFNGA